MYILGISCYYHDSAAVILKNGSIIAAAQEERFSRVRHDSSFPTHAVKFCLTEANISIDKIDKIVFYEDPELKFKRLKKLTKIFSHLQFRSYFQLILNGFSKQKIGRKE
jgi:carbamoyltransferase